MTSLPVTKNPLVYASAAEVATKFKMLQLTCIGPLRRSRAHFEGMIPKKIYPAAQLLDCGSFRYDAMHWCWHIKSCLKREI